MATNAITGIELWQNTELGRALKKILPPEITRVIIDIQIKAPVKIYYASIDTGPILDLKWDEIIEKCEVVKPEGHISLCEYDRYECARCGFSTVIDSVMSKHLAGCKVPLNGYGG